MPNRPRLRRSFDLALFALRRLGPSGAVGAVLILAALLAQHGLGAAAQQRIERSRAELASLRTTLASAEQKVTPADRLSAFYAALGLPEDEEGERTPLAVIHTAARQQGVRLARGDYRTVRDGGGRVIRHQLTLPLKAPYPALRAWLAEVMNSLPGAAIEGLALKRDKVGSDIVEAQLRLVVYVHARVD